MHWYDLDNTDRANKNIQASIHHGPAGTTAKTAPSHLMIDAYGKSPALDRIVDIILSNPKTAAVLRKSAGAHVKIRGYNIRLMTGSHEPGSTPALPKELMLPHEWHRDSPGEFGIGIFLSDVPEGGNGGTALMRGSHLFPYCPRKNSLLSTTWRASSDGRVMGRPWLARFNIFNRLLSKRLRNRAEEANGTRGDCYLFFNDTWHGRYPNLHGRQGMIVLVAGFPTEFPFPDEVKPQPPEVLERLPASIRQGLTPQPENSDTSSLVYWMAANRRRALPFGLFSLARFERLFANRLTLALDGLAAWRGLPRKLARLLRRSIGLARRAPGAAKR